MAVTFRRATREDLLSAARARFLRGRQLDVEELGEQLGVSRATAYRWAGSVEALTGDVIASIAAETFERCVREASGTGAQRILDVQRRGMRYLMTSKPYRSWLEKQNPDTALRIVASRHGAPQGTMIRLNQALLEDEMRAGRYSPPVDAHTLAYAIVRTAETFLYADLIAGEKPDVDKAIAIMGLIVGAAG